MYTFEFFLMRTYIGDMEEVTIIAESFVDDFSEKESSVHPPAYLSEQNIVCVTSLGEPQRNERARFLRSQRISDRTRKAYDSHIKHFVNYLQANHPHLLDSSENVQLSKVDLVVLDNYFTDLKSRRRGEETENASLHALNASRAAIRSYYIDHNVPIPDWFDTGLRSLFQGFKRTAAKHKREHGISSKNEEGKSPFSFNIFHFLMKSIMFSTSPNPFAHLFGLLSWSMMSRGDNTASINVRNMGWYEDALTVKLAHAKNDQTGEHSISTEPRHIYANPINPEICPILSLGIYFSTSFNAPNESSLFLGERQKDRMLQYIPEYLRSELVQKHMKLLGMVPTDFGNHSFRKGAATYVASGSVGGPSIISVLRRAGWSLGDTLGRYLKADPAGDQYVGRVVVGLPISSHKFAVLPPQLRVDDEKVCSKCFASYVDMNVLFILYMLNTNRLQLQVFYSSIQCTLFIIDGVNYSIPIC
jgi:hypothetical protein